MSADRTPLDDFTDAIRLLVDEIRQNSTTPALELAAALDTPRNVRPMPSDHLRMETFPVIGGPARLLVGYQVDRVRVTIVVPSGKTVYLTTRDGAEATSSDCIAVTGQTIELATRAPIYATAGAAGAAAVNVSVIGELAEFSL